MKYILIVVLIFSFSCTTSQTLETQRMDPEMFANLGDGTHTDHFYPIVDKLLKRITSLKKRNDILNDYEKAKKENLKSWFSSMAETQFSHLIGKLAKANNLARAAVYDRLGIAVGYTGSNFGKNKGGLRLHYSLEEVATFLRIKNVLFKKVNANDFIAIRPIKTIKDKIIGFSVVSFNTCKFNVPKILEKLSASSSLQL